MYNVHLLPALFGDAILIEYGTKSSPKYIMIDGGPYYGVEDMTRALKKVAPKLNVLELLVVTHIDIDHIDGIITMLNQPKLPFAIKEIWFNGRSQLKSIKSSMLGALQGEYLSRMIKEKKIPHNISFKKKAVMVKDPKKLPEIKLDGGMTLTLLSPHLEALQNLRNTWNSEVKALIAKESIEDRWEKEKRYSRDLGTLLGGKPPHPDVSVANASSIAFIAAFDKKSCLFAGDTMSAELLKSIEPLNEKNGTSKLAVHAWKLAHHGSKKSTMTNIMEKIDTKTILISTNGDRYKHPDKECIESLLKNTKGLTIHFNYKSSCNKYWEETAPQKKWKYQAIYSDSDAGISVKI